jgi:D-alanyl-D-alanine carboxypeptidase
VTFRQSVRVVLQAFFLVTLVVWLPLASAAAPYAAMVMDARSGEVLHSRNADTRLHPASLTKMMTLYVVFDAIRKGELSLDSEIRISQKAASEPPSKLGLKAGQRIKLRYLIRAAAVKSANDAATALGEAVSGSEAAFARRMNRMAKAMGMSRTTFRNAHGLTEDGHLSTARDMTELGRHLLYDFPEYYNLFSRRSTDAGGRTVNNTNRRLLASYRGADGIKTGYTRAAGYNLVASAERDGERIIATVFGGQSSVSRNNQVAELLDLGFSRAPSRVAVNKPPRPVLLAEGAPEPGAGKTLRTTGLIASSPRPTTRPTATPDAEVLVAMADGIADALAEVAVEVSGADADEILIAGADVPPPAPESVMAASLAGAFLRPAPRPVVAEGSAPDPDDVAEEDTGPVIVMRLSTSGGRHWGINVGRFTTRHEAEKMLLQTALVEMSTLDDALRKVVQSPKGWEANFVGMSAERAELACRRLLAQNVSCQPVGPG